MAAKRYPTVMVHYFDEHGDEYIEEVFDPARVAYLISIGGEVITV